MKWYCIFLFQLSAIACWGQQPGKVIRTTAEVTLIPEGIAIDGRTGKIYISSINQHKIIRVDKKGSHKDFIRADQHGYLEGLGMKIDQERNWIWALSNKEVNGKYHSQLQAFHLGTGEEKDSYKLSDTAQHLFNDLVIINGKIYITDTYYSAIYQYDINEKKWEVAKRHPHITYPNGICSDGKGSIYIATYQNGIIRMDLKSRETSIVTGYTQPEIVRGLDGLVYSRNTLIGIYNLGGPEGQRIMEYRLSKNGETIIGEKEIDKGNSLFEDPTTLAMHKRYIYVIANSYLDQFNKNKESTAGIEDKLSPPVIIRYRVKGTSD